MKKFLALGLLGISHACDETVRTDCIQDSTGLYRPATSTETITNLVLTKITSGIHKDKYNISDCSNTASGKKEWGDDREGNVVECGITTLADLAPGLDLNVAYENGQGGTYRRILVAPTNAMCDSLDGTSDPTLGAVCTVGSFTGALIGNAGSTECAGETCVSLDAATCCQITCGLEEYNTAALGNKKVCLSWSTCGDGKHQSNIPSATQNRLCGDNTCTCDGGTYATGADCTDHEHEICTECDTDYFLSGGKCKASVTGFKSFTARKSAMKTKETLKTVGARTAIQVEAAVLERFQKIQAAMDDAGTGVPDFSDVTCDNGGKKCIRDAMGVSEMTVIIDNKKFKMLQTREVFRTKNVAKSNRVKMSKNTKIKFNMAAVGGDDNQCIEISPTLVCCLTLTLNDALGDIACVFEPVVPKRRLAHDGVVHTVANTCFEATATYSSTDGTYTFNPGAVLIDKRCSATKNTAADSISYDVELCSQTPQTYTGNTDIVADDPSSGPTASFDDSGNTTCGVCGKGNGLVPDTETCEVCDNDPDPVWNNDFDDSSCGVASDCGVGYGWVAHATNTANTQCKACVDSYSDTLDKTTACKDCSPLQCSATQFEQACTTSANGQCVDCTDIGNATTVQCSTDSDQTILTCDAGYYGSPGDASCKMCAAGSITNAGISAGATTCTPCAAGLYSLSSNVASCSTCNSIAHAATVQCTTASDQTITTCDAEYYENTGDASCTKCDANSVNCAGTSKGECKAGYSEDGASCAQCVTGKFKSGIGNDDCTDCTPGASGDYTSEPGQSACKSCSGFSTEWINSQCCSKTGPQLDVGHCGILKGQCSVSC